MAAPTSVEDYLASLPEDSRAALEKLRNTIKAAEPEATLPAALVKKIVRVRLEENTAR